MCSLTPCSSMIPDFRGEMSVYAIILVSVPRYPRYPENPIVDSIDSSSSVVSLYLSIFTGSRPQFVDLNLCGNSWKSRNPEASKRDSYWRWQKNWKASEDETPLTIQMFDIWFNSCPPKLILYEGKTKCGTKVSCMDPLWLGRLDRSRRVLDVELRSLIGALFAPLYWNSKN